MGSCFVLHFHATTAKDILRSKEVPVGKRDYTGNLRLKTRPRVRLPWGCGLPKRLISDSMPPSAERHNEFPELLREERCG